MTDPKKRFKATSLRSTRVHGGEQPVHFRLVICAGDPIATYLLVASVVFAFWSFASRRARSTAQRPYFSTIAWSASRETCRLPRGSFDQHVRSTHKEMKRNTQQPPSLTRKPFVSAPDEQKLITQMWRDVPFLRQGFLPITTP